MKYEIEDTNLADTYKTGEYFVNALDELFQIIYDPERGFALLVVSESAIASEFHFDMKELIKYTTLGDMRRVYQTNKVMFSTQFVNLEEE